jgi:hypothetical protein
MSQSTETMRRVRYWATPTVCAVAGLAFLFAAWHRGRPGLGVALLAFMLAYAAALLLAARRSETVRGLLDRRDERIVAMDLRATAFAGIAVIVVILVAAIAELGRGHSGAPYSWLGAIAGLAYLAAVVVQRLRG